MSEYDRLKKQKEEIQKREVAKIVSCELNKIVSERDQLREQLSIAHKHIQDMQVTNGSLTATVDHWKSVAGKLKEALGLIRNNFNATTMDRADEALALFSASRGEEAIKTKAEEILYSGQCAHHIPFGQPCQLCDRT